MTTSTIPPVQQSVTVAAPAQRAFDVFAGSMISWWPASHHIGAAELADVQLEPREGGRWYERGADGRECDWGRVLSYDPPRRLVLAWHLNGEWRYDPDPALASEIEVTFTAETPDRTRVELVHRGIERHGASAEQLAKEVGGESGWHGILARYAETATA